MNGVPDLRPDILSVEVSGASATINISLGTINVWFGRHMDPLYVARIMRLISRVDVAAEHEREVLCSFDRISEFEADGYIVISYARKGDVYRVIFVIPFSKERALDRFIDYLLDEMRHGDVRVSIRWRGGFSRIKFLLKELSKLNYFTTFDPTYRKEP